MASEDFKQSYLDQIPQQQDAFVNSGDSFNAAGNIQSPNYSPNTNAGWQLQQNGDATLNNVVIKGRVTATAGGVVGGFDINSKSITDTGDSFGLDSSVTGSDDVRFYAGASNANKNTAPIRVYESGIIKAGSADEIVIDGPNKKIESSNYSAGISGFHIDKDLVEAQNIIARGVMRGSVFAYDRINAVGGQLLISNADVLSRDMTALDSSTVLTKGDTTFSINDLVVIRANDSTGIKEEWMRITATALTSATDSYNESNANTSASVDSVDPQSYGQSFTGAGGYLTKAKFYISKNGSPTGNIVARLYAHSGTFGTSGVPTGAILKESSPVDISTLSTSNALVDFTFDGSYNLVNGTHYFITIYYAGGNATDKLLVGADTTAPTHAGNSAYYSSFTWTYGSMDIVFYVYENNGLAANEYSVTRDLAGIYSANNNPTWKSGTPIVTQGASDGASSFSGGWLKLIGAGTSSPYYSVLARTGVAYNAYVEVARFGNLNGFLGYASDLYGIAIGNSSANLKYDPTNGFSLTGANTDFFVLTATNNTRTSGGSGSTGATSYTKIKEILFKEISGTIRVSFDLAASTSTHSVFARIYKNGVAYGTERTTSSSSPTTYTEDLAFNTNDLIQIYGWAQAGYSSQITNFNLNYDKSNKTATNTVNL